MSDRISESSILRAAGNIAAGLVLRRNKDYHESYLSEESIAIQSVRLARKIAAEVERTKPEGKQE